MLKHIIAILRHLFTGTMLGAIFLYVFIIFVGSPKQWKLERDYKILQQHYKMLEQRVDADMKIIDGIAERDDNLYRVLLHADPVGEELRNRIKYSQQLYDSLMELPDGELASDLTKRIELMERKMFLQSRSFDEIVELTKTQADMITHFPAIQPIKAKDMRSLASGYGLRVDPIYNVTKFHEGMDFSAPTGTEVFATGDGVVVSARFEKGYGNMVTIDHGYGYRTRYAHLSKILTHAGRRVHRGDKIGLVGSTGKSTGPHLHYEVWLNGRVQNPAYYYYLDLSPEEYEEMLRLAESRGIVMD